MEANDIRFSYGDAPVLRGVSLAVSAGEVVVMLGPNGAGKSTLLRALLGQLAVDGEVRWDGRNVKSWSRRELARRVAYLPQSPAADGDQSVAEVLQMGRAPYWGAFGLESARDLRVVREVAHRLGLTDLLPRPMAELSGGQRQRVFVGRCLVQEPSTLLMDEPSTFLDLRHQIELSQLLQKLARERSIAILMASHDLNLAAMIADRLILLCDGAIAAEGTPAAVLKPDIVGRIYKIDMRTINAAGTRVPLILPKAMFE
jgi:iron complex transport system ATP-binding protein